MRMFSRPNQSTWLIGFVILLQAAAAAEGRPLQEDVCEDTTLMTVGMKSSTPKPVDRKQSYQGMNVAGGALLQVTSNFQAMNELTSDKVDHERVHNASAFVLSALGSKLGSMQPPKAKAGPKGDVVITVAPIKCGVPIFAPDGNCPARCPYFSPEAGAARACYFICLTAAQCGVLGDRTRDIADPGLRICRKCRVLGCKKCLPGKGDTCAACGSGYELVNGYCTSQYMNIWIVVFIIAGIVGAFLAFYLVTLQLEDVTNAEGVQEGLSYRSSLKLRLPRPLSSDVIAPSEAQLVQQHVHSQHRETGQADAEERPLWPVFATNLHAVRVAGAGLALHFNFQMWVLGWGCFVVVVWVIFTYSTTADMLVLGLHKGNTPQELCATTLKGKELQTAIMPTKVIFLAILLVFSALFNFAYALFQRRKFLQMDDEASMGDFVAICQGLPCVTGDEHLEDELKEVLEENLGVVREDVVGVSVCWDYKDREEDVDAAIEKEVLNLESDHRPNLPDQATIDELSSKSIHRRALGWVDGLFGFTGKLPEDSDSGAGPSEVVDLLKGMMSTDTAFVVFTSEDARDKAVGAFAASGGVSFRGSTITLVNEVYEPGIVKWTNFKVTNGQFWLRCTLGVLGILFALFAWGVLFYLPQAAYRASYAEQAMEPPFIAGMTFTLLVVAGNQTMYFLAREIAERVGFRNNDHCEAFYIFLYTGACVINVFVDMVMEFLMSYEANKTHGAHTADGRSLQDLTGYQEIFESYVMQRDLGLRLFAYCFPSTFFVPFLAEPIAAIFFPFHICKLLVGTHPEVRGREAEKSMEFFTPMDMGRYGDILLNLMLSVLIVFYPPGTFLKMMLCFVISHVYIYVYDHYRVLRCVPEFEFATDTIDRSVQLMMGVPTMFLAVAVVFKGSCLEGTGVCVKSGSLVLLMIGVAVVTMLFHVVMISAIVPLFDKEHKVTHTTYQQVAATQPENWFSNNPVHCLRSKYIYAHSPPCIYNARGKGHLIEPNPEIGIYFSDKNRGTCVEYNDVQDLLSTMISAKNKFKS